MLSEPGNGLSIYLISGTTIDSKHFGRKIPLLHRELFGIVFYIVSFTGNSPCELPKRYRQSVLEHPRATGNSLNGSISHWENAPGKCESTRQSTRKCTTHFEASPGKYESTTNSWRKKPKRRTGIPGKRPHHRETQVVEGDLETAAAVCRMISFKRPP